MSTCTNCARSHAGKVHSGGRCESCYRRDLRIARNLPIAIPIDVVGRIQLRITVDAAGCHVFQGAKTNGYGKISAGGRRGGSAYAHRIMYEAVHGPIPEGLHVDHLCRNRACVNPEHLEAVTQAENNRRAAVANDNGSRGVRRTQASSVNPWVASMTVAGRSVHIGLFPTKEAAVAARRKAAIEAEVNALQGVDS